jgi:peptidoglycan/xylan/chitin deacetylase (PgdA/CDA1 family)
MYTIEVVLAYILYYTGICWIWRKWLEKRGANIVLVYHRVLSGKRKTGEMVGDGLFDWQMGYIKKHFHSVNWQDIISSGCSSSGIRILITFDDGYRDNFTRALPIIEKYQLQAVFFVATDLVFKQQIINLDVDHDGNDIFPSPDNLQRARRSPFITFGNHTASHRIASQISLDEFEHELSSSQGDFYNKLDILPEIFAFPRGRTKDIIEGVIPLLERHNIRAAFTMIPGIACSNTECYFIPRIGVSHVNNKVLFKVKVLGLLTPFVKVKNYLQR